CGRNTPPEVAFAYGHGHADTEALLDLKAFQELQRLAYVACTRARRQMIWVDDSGFYDKTDGSFADALGITNGDNAAVWHALPLWQPAAEPDTDPEQATAAQSGGDTFIAQGQPVSL